jgi:NADPH2:quinone reductase
MTLLSRAIQITAFGGPDNMQLVDTEVGQPGPGEIRIRHHAVGLNYIDVYQRTGLYPNAMPLQLGMEGAGVVEAVGEGVAHLAIGDRAAYASNPPGSYCERRVMPARCVVKLPDDISFETGAAMMLKGLTAQYLLRRTLPQGGLNTGDFILWHAAAGGVGLIACQWARALGLQLIGTAGSDEKCALAREHGATHTINYRSEDFVARVKEITGGAGVKAVYDSVGADTFMKSLDCLAAPSACWPATATPRARCRRWTSACWPPRARCSSAGRRCSPTSPPASAPRPWPMSCSPWCNPAR